MKQQGDATQSRGMLSLGDGLPPYATLIKDGTAWYVAKNRLQLLFGTSCFIAVRAQGRSKWRSRVREWFWMS